MRVGFAYVTMVALLGCCIAGLGGATSSALATRTTVTLTLTDQDNGRHLSLHVGDMLEIRLAENATTGYRWLPDNYDASILELADATGSYPSAAVGSGGVANFRFRVIGAGSSTLELKYWRHWEGAGSIIQRFAVTIDAGP